MITKEQQKEVRELHSMLMEYLSEHTNVCTDVETKDEIRAFVRIFMRPNDRYNRKITSYDLKHVAEKVIGKILRRGEGSYVSNNDFKEVMKEPEFVCHYYPKPYSKGEPNDIYMWRLTCGADYWLALFDIYDMCFSYKI